MSMYLLSGIVRGVIDATILAEGSDPGCAVLAPYAVLGIFLIRAATDPSEHASPISLVVWSSAVHALIMAVQALRDARESGHLIGDVPALLLVAAVLGFLTSRKR